MLRRFGRRSIAPSLRTGEADVPEGVARSTDHLLDPKNIEAAITKRTKAIVVVHLYGMVCCNNDDLAWEIRSVRDHGYDVKSSGDKALMKGLEGHPLVKYAPVDTKDRQNSFWLVPFVLATSKLKCTILHARPHQGGRRRVQEGRQGDDEVTGSPAKEKGREDVGLPAFFGIIRRR